MGIEITTVNGDRSPAQVGTVDASNALVRNVVANKNIPGRSICARAVYLNTMVGA